MRIPRYLAFFAVFLLVVQALMIVTQQSNRELLGQVTDLITVLEAAAAAIALGAVALFGKRDKQLVCIAVAFLLFAFGDMYWAYAELVLGQEVPLGSLADVAWVLAYFFLMGGLFLTLQRKKVQTIWPLLMGGLVVAVGVGVYQVSFLEELSFGGFANVLYIAFDVLLLAILGALAWSAYVHGGATNYLVLLGCAIIARVVFDFTFAGLAAGGIYYTGSPIDLFYDLSYTLAAFAADQHSRS